MSPFFWGQYDKVYVVKMDTVDSSPSASPPVNISTSPKWLAITVVQLQTLAESADLPDWGFDRNWSEAPRTHHAVTA